MVNIEEKSPHVSRKRGGKGVTYSTLQMLPSGKTILPEPYLLVFIRAYPTYRKGNTQQQLHLAILHNLMGENKTEKHHELPSQKS
jgi:hypothetical protein